MKLLLAVPIAVQSAALSEPECRDHSAAGTMAAYTAASRINWPMPMETMISSLMNHEPKRHGFARGTPKTPPTLTVIAYSNTYSASFSYVLLDAECGVSSRERHG